MEEQYANQKVSQKESYGYYMSKKSRLARIYERDYDLVKGLAKKDGRPFIQELSLIIDAGLGIKRNRS